MSKPGISLLLLGVLVTCLPVSCMAASTSQKATIVSVHLQVRTQTTDTMRDYLLDTAFVTTRSLVYTFEVQCGSEVYRSEYIYTGELNAAPKEWNPEVQIRIQGSRMFIEEPNGSELETKIVSHTKS
jgi:hypothetical protein